MRSLLICPDDFLFQLFRGTAFPGEPPLYVVRDPAARARIARRGETVISGDLEEPATYRRAFRTGTESALLTAPRDRVGRMLAALRAAVPHAPLVVIKEDDGPPAEIPSGVITLPLSAFTERLIQPAIERAQLRGRVERIRDHFAAAERVLLMMQDDPDPDAIASALALRTLLGRNKASASIATFGSVTRPENRAMCRILEIDVEEIQASTLSAYDRVAIVDAQPAFFEQRFKSVDLVIDHHPEARGVKAFVKDIRPSYQATSTILTEYLRAADVKITQRLATALLYGIMSDTLHLERGCTRPDLDAFTYLHLLANHNALRRIDRPELPLEALDTLAQGLARRRIHHGVLFSHLGRVAHLDLIPQFADFFLNLEGIEWAVVSGVVNGADGPRVRAGQGEELHISVRNVGYVKSAGEAVRVAFGDLGKAGGHRAMAKAVIRLKEWEARVGDTSDDALEHGIVERFLAAFGTHDQE